ncbi:hypothetical protein SSX86_020639 [Deinandra increscens subsp. villosa]|uniref:Receptor-like serine/threonine-protein kinase n=1 Tax=Deinandra increscens subsp. villosa TaxID=3103831 RepID=A0AAP0CNB1_9ASTR
MRISYYFSLFLFLNGYYTTTAQQPLIDRTADLSTTWFLNSSSPFVVNFEDGSRVQPIFLRGSNFACGFYCNGVCISYLFAVFIVQIDSKGNTSYVGYPQVVWSANRDHPVSDGAVLSLTAAGELVLQDADRNTVWFTSTGGKSVVGLNLTDHGNLMLFDRNSSPVWQSFDSPTDCLVMGQTLYQGQRLIPSVSSITWTAQKDLFSLQVIDKGLVAYVGSDPPQEYFHYFKDNYTNAGSVRFFNGSLSLFVLSVEASEPIALIILPPATSIQYMKLMPDGHLTLFEWRIKEWLMVADLLYGSYGNCNYPMACGRYGVCSANQQCSCPASSSSKIEYFRAENDRQLNMGCSEITPLTYMERVDMETCKQACLNNCSCKAALFQYGFRSLTGDCFLPSDLFTMVYVHPNVTNGHNASTFVKVQNVGSTPSGPSGPSGPVDSKPQSTLRVMLTSIIGGAMFLLGTTGFLVYIIRKRRRATQMEEEYIDDVPDLPTRFSYVQLKTATHNFNKKLGEGGFGAVYEGTLEDGSKIAVKRLEGLAQVKKSFLAEVKSIGSIHHVNLVKLRGFCAWRSLRFLVYEFMSNGSLDRWIYHGYREHPLDWECRKKIILDVAKGLAYLHEDCRQKIIHLDIKPQNILVDNNFNAKVSDFGLSKLIDRDQTQVMITMRGTPGYMAPEWLSLVITEKVDVYSFGIVLLEMLCGRKNFDRSQPEESWHLLAVLQKCWEQNMLVDMVDKYTEDMQTHGLEVVEMIKVASWCLQYDFTKRPSMSTIVKVLEGVAKVESRLDYNFTDPRLQKIAVEHEKDTTPLLASVLSGPRCVALLSNSRTYLPHTVQCFAVEAIPPSPLNFSALASAIDHTFFLPDRGGVLGFLCSDYTVDNRVEFARKVFGGMLETKEKQFDVESKSLVDVFEPK